MPCSVVQQNAYSSKQYPGLVACDCSSFLTCGYILCLVGWFHGVLKPDVATECEVATEGVN